MPIDYNITDTIASKTVLFPPPRGYGEKFCFKKVFKTFLATYSIMHWSLLIVASSMGKEENLRDLPRATASIHLPSCDTFLAPSTIFGSASVRRTRFCMLCGLVFNFSVLNEFAIHTGDIGLQLYMQKFERCAYAPASVPCEFYRQLIHRFCALIPNSWFRSFCRTRFQTRRYSAVELDDTVFA